MDRTTLARKLREALFDHIEAGRRDALQDSAVDSLFEKVLASWVPPTVSDEKVRTTANLVVGDGFDLYTAAEPTFTHTTTAASAWGHSHTLTMAEMPTPAIGDVDLSIASVYGYKDGIAQWVSIHDPIFDAVMAATEAQT